MVCAKKNEHLQNLVGGGGGDEHEHVQLNMYKTHLFVEEVMKRAASSATKPQLSEAPLQ